jgi:hypothetical protein
LEEKPRPLALSYVITGTYFVDRFMFDKNCLVIQWYGDNPNSMAGFDFVSSQRQANKAHKLKSIVDASLDDVQHYSIFVVYGGA